MVISRQKQLIPYPTRERAATVQRIVLTRSSRKRRQSCRNYFVGSCRLFFRGTITDGSLPGNAPLRWLQNTNDSGACTPPIPQRRANRYFAYLFATDKTQTGRAPQMPDSHIRHAQSPVQ